MTATVCDCYAADSNEVIMYEYLLEVVLYYSKLQSSVMHMLCMLPLCLELNKSKSG